MTGTRTPVEPEVNDLESTGISPIITIHDLYLFDESERVAAALGTMLSQRDSTDPKSLTTTTAHFDVDSDQLRRAVHRPGVEVELIEPIESLPGDSTAITATHACLDERNPVPRTYGGFREGHWVNQPQECRLSFQSWLLAETTTAVREPVDQLLHDEFGADTLQHAASDSVR